MAEAFFTQATDFLTYITYRGTEYYKIFALRNALSENTLFIKEVEILQFIGVDGFNAFINKGKYLELLDAKVKRAYPDAVIPERALSAHEQQMVEQHVADMLVKEEEIANLQEEIRRRTEDVEKKETEVENLRKEFDKKRTELEGKLEAEVKRVEEVKQSLEAERNRLKEFNSKPVALEGELKTEKEEKSSMKDKYQEDIKKATASIEKMGTQISNYEGEIIKLGSEANRATLKIHNLEAEIKVLKSKLDEANSELESRRIVARDVYLKQAELGIKLDDVNKQAGDFATKINVVSQINVMLNNRERTLVAQ